MGLLKGTKNKRKLGIGNSSAVQIKGFSKKRDKESKIVAIAAKKITKSGTKRKRVYAGTISDEERMDFLRVEKKSARNSVNNKKEHLPEEKGSRHGKPKFAKLIKRKGSLKDQSKSKENRLSCKKNLRANVKDLLNAGKYKEGEECRSGNMKRGAKSKLVVTKMEVEKNQEKRAPGSVFMSTKKKMIPIKKSTSNDDDCKGMDERPKKKKRVIRIDPHDGSNKRLDDGLASNNVRVEKDDSKNSDVQLSKNAQFRSICPSPSILSFVEDNFLGRRREIEFKRAGYNIELSAPLDNIPNSSGTERERVEETVFRNKLEFFAAAKLSSSLPPPDLPEIAFAGRSNVGKSSLLNSLTRQWGVARTSDKPGLTQTINFFNLGSKLCLVDLPGYGFAYAKQEVKEAWEELVKEYVRTRVGLKRVCLLVDTKWGMRPRDFELIDLMERYQTKYQIVLTKTDLVFPIDVARRAMQVEESLKEKKSAVQPVMMVSSKTGGGVRSLRTVLAKIARFLKP